MSKFLKAIVNIVLLVAILSAGALLIPPLLGVTTKVSNGTGNTNLSRGSVTYATSARADELEVGDKILREDSSGSYVYTVSAIASDTSVYTLKDEVSQKTQEQQLTGGVQKVVLTLPAIGMLSLTLQSREGIIILGLCVAFLIILFILSEVWRKDDDEDEEDDEEDEENDDGEKEDADGERVLTRREKRQLKKEKRRKEKEEEEAQEDEDDADSSAEEQEAESVPDSDEKQPKDEEDTVKPLEEEPEEEVVVNTDSFAKPSQESRESTETVPDAADEDSELERSLAEAVGELMGKEDEDAAAGKTEDSQKEETGPDAINMEETAQAPETPDALPADETEEKKDAPVELAIPVHTAEELLKKAEEAGDHPKVIEDRETGVTILDYTDVL